MDTLLLKVMPLLKLRTRMCLILCRIVPRGCGHYIRICSKLSGGSGWRYILTEHAKVCAKWAAE
jgi:hypothetical protein